MTTEQERIELEIKRLQLERERLALEEEKRRLARRDQVAGAMRGAADGAARFASDTTPTALALLRVVWSRALRLVFVLLVGAAVCAKWAWDRSEQTGNFWWWFGASIPVFGWVILVAAVVAVFYWRDAGPGGWEVPPKVLAVTVVFLLLAAFLGGMADPQRGLGN